MQMKLLAGAAALTLLMTGGASAAPAGQVADRGPAVHGAVPPQGDVHHSWFDGVAGQKLVGVDGSTLSFNYTEDGLSRSIVSPAGDDQETGFAFINEKLGTVSDAGASGDVVGFFRSVDAGFEVTYADGRIEAINTTPDGGVKMTLRTPGDGAYCMGWYPQGHVFSEAERRAALAQYAQKLGLASPGARAVGVTTCGSASQAAQPAPPAPTRGAAIAMAPVKMAAATRTVSMPVIVPVSAVQPIDAELAMPPAEQSADAAAANGASSCLRVDSDGSHWGFRNHCGYGVQYSYCLENAKAGASCNDGPASGTVAANGFSALFSQSALQDLDAQQNFRWVACGQNDGAVEAKLDQASPPSGRCIRSAAKGG